MLSKSEASIEQCRLNIVAVLRYHRCPAYDGSGLGDYRILACLPDRIIIEPSTGMAGYLLSELQTSEVFRYALLDHKLHGPTAIWTMRECVPFGSMQITGHRSPAATTVHCIPTGPMSAGLNVETTLQEKCTWELDIDHGNPAYLSSQSGHRDLVSIFKGVASLIVHGCEVAYPGKTNPWWIRRRLVSRGIQVPLVATPGEV